MKFAYLALVLGSFLLSAAAQTTPPPADAPPMPCCTHQSMAGMGNMPAMQKHMQEMKEQVAKMRSTLHQMKASAARMKDPSLKQQAQFDVDLWEAMLQHLEGMVSMMAPPSAMGAMHRMDHDGMACCCCGGMQSGANKCMPGAAPAINDKPAPPPGE